MTVGIVVLIACLLVAFALELLRRRYDGRFREQPMAPSDPTAPAAPTPRASTPDTATSAPVSAAGGATATGDASAAGATTPGSRATAPTTPTAPTTQDAAATATPEARPPGTGAPARTPGRTDRPAPRLTADDLGTDLGDRATLVQFSSAFCAPCRTTRQLLRDIAAKEPGISYAEIDAESHLDLVRRLHILRTPTVLVLDPHGWIATRASGLPRRPDVMAAVQSVSRSGVR